MRIFTKLFLFSCALFFSGALAWAQCPTGQIQVTVTIVEDAWGSETEWNISDGMTALLSGGPYTDGNAGNVHVETVCVPVNGPLTFTITDAFGDGICCGYGEGAFEVKINDCNVLATGGGFTSSETVNFTPVDRSLTDVGMTDVDLHAYVGFGMHAVKGELINLGMVPITSMDLNYLQIGGTLATQSVTGLNILPCETYAFEHATPWEANAIGNYVINVFASNINGVVDQNPGNDILSSTVDVYEVVSIRVPLIEDFGSSTCPPCADLAVYFDPALHNYGVNEVDCKVTALKYQMNWPSPGSDPSYMPDGQSRRTYYGVSGIPHTRADGTEMTNASRIGFDQARAIPAFMDLDVRTSIVGNQVNVVVTVNPLVDFPSSNLLLHVAVTEDAYTFNGGTTSQTLYEQIVRKMLPNANGTPLGPLTTGTPVTNSFSYTFTIGGVAQGNYNLWTSMENLTVVAFVQDNATKEIHQSAPEGAATVGIEDELNELITGFNVFPNPATDMTFAMLEIAEKSAVSLQMVNAVGQAVYTNEIGLVPAGQHTFDVNVNGLAEGVYFVNMQVGEHSLTRRILVK